MVSYCILQGHVYRQSRVARPLPGGRLRQINDRSFLGYPPGDASLRYRTRLIGPPTNERPPHSVAGGVFFSGYCFVCCCSLNHKPVAQILVWLSAPEWEIVAVAQVFPGISAPGDGSLARAGGLGRGERGLFLNHLYLIHLWPVFAGKVDFSGGRIVRNSVQYIGGRPA